MDYKEKIVELLKENMTEKSFKLWNGINKRLPDIWNKLSASTRKYHRKFNGEVPDIAEHTYEMLFSAVDRASFIFSLKWFSYPGTGSDTLITFVGHLFTEATGA